MSPAEVALWRELRKNPGGFHFRRQHPAGEYDLDFFCARSALAIEVDGAYHDRGDQPARDEVRDAWLESQGVTTLRIPVKAIFEELDGVVSLILSTAASRRPPPPRR